MPHSFEKAAVLPRLCRPLGVAQTLMSAGWALLPSQFSCANSAEKSLRTPKVAPEFRWGLEIDLSQSRVPDGSPGQAEAYPTDHRRLQL
jgi:hypothetical protein